MKTSRADIAPYRTKDGSDIREFMHPSVHGRRFGVTRQSLAEATVAPGTRTELHRHQVTEELYHITAGAGRMTLGDHRFDVAAGDTVCIVPGTPHCIENTGGGALVLLCMCTPPYDHADTQLLQAVQDGKAAES
jgi:mannose-6-phosphate isomerase-like protein (cupin superfamily)